MMRAVLLTWGFTFLCVLAFGGEAYGQLVSPRTGSRSVGDRYLGGRKEWYTVLWHFFFHPAPLYVLVCRRVCLSVHNVTPQVIVTQSLVSVSTLTCCCSGFSCPFLIFMFLGL